jgi:hypothetical protein
MLTVGRDDTTFNLTDYVRSKAGICVTCCARSMLLPMYFQDVIIVPDHITAVTCAPDLLLIRIESPQKPVCYRPIHSVPFVPKMIAIV